VSRERERSASSCSDSRSPGTLRLDGPPLHARRIDAAVSQRQANATPVNQRQYNVTCDAGNARSDRPRNPRGASRARPDRRPTAPHDAPGRLPGHAPALADVRQATVPAPNPPRRPWTGSPRSRASSRCGQRSAPRCECRTAVGPAVREFRRSTRQRDLPTGWVEQLRRRWPGQRTVALQHHREQYRQVRHRFRRRRHTPS
jgi:hypothetical protein